MIAINSIRMPEECSVCFACLRGCCRLDEDNRIVVPALPDESLEGRPEWCPLVDVPDEAGNCSEIPNNSTDRIRRQKDLIDRKRALEEMTFSGGIIEQDGVLYVPLRDVNNHLKSLPSVQPEILACGSGELKVQPEVDEWCTNCPAYDHENHYCPRFRKVIRKTVNEIKSEQSEIIHCKDCVKFHEPTCLMAYDGREWADYMGFCHGGERDADGSD